MGPLDACKASPPFKDISCLKRLIAPITARKGFSIAAFNTSNLVDSAVEAARCMESPFCYVRSSGTNFGGAIPTKDAVAKILAPLPILDCGNCHIQNFTVLCLGSSLTRHVGCGIVHHGLCLGNNIIRGGRIIVHHGRDIAWERIARAHHVGRRLCRHRTS